MSLCAARSDSGSRARSPRWGAVETIARRPDPSAALRPSPGAAGGAHDPASSLVDSSRCRIPGTEIGRTTPYGHRRGVSRDRQGRRRPRPHRQPVASHDHRVGPRLRRHNRTAEHRGSGHFNAGGLNARWSEFRMSSTLIIEGTSDLGPAESHRENGQRRLLRTRVASDTRNLLRVGRT